MISYAATFLGFWICVTVWTLAACWALDAVTGYIDRCRGRRSVYLARVAASDPCPFCGARRGLHDQGCGLLDRLDAPRREVGSWSA